MPDLQRRQFLPWTGPGANSGVFDGNKVQDINNLKNALAKGIKEAVDRLDIDRIRKLTNEQGTKKELTDLLLKDFNKYFVLLK